ncbi:MAG: ABC transporter substrate-binding protein [Qipengyuania sp.]
MRVLALAAAMLVAGCSGVQPRDAAGDRPTIVSLNPCTDAILAEVAEPAQLLAISHYSHHPRATSMNLAKARRFRATGGTVEEVLALDPDLVVAGSFLAPATRAALEDMGMQVETFDAPSSVEDSLSQIRRLAVLANNKAGGQALAARIAAAARPIRGEPVDTILWQAGGIVPGESALVSELLGRAGLRNQTTLRGMGQADYLALEQVVADPPELLLVAGGERGQRHPVLEQLPQTRRVSFNPSLVYCGGPTIIRAMERLRELRREAA